MKPSQKNQIDAEIEKLKSCLRLNHLSLSTEKTYAHWVRRYAGFLLTHRKEPSSEARFEAFLTMLAKGGVAPSTQNQAYNAIQYYYKHVRRQPLSEISALRAKAPKRIRTALSRADMSRALELVQDEGRYPTRLICHLLYGCGLRVSEPLNLRVKDVDFENSRILVREAKGGKDRFVSLPCSLVADLQEQVQFAHSVWQQDKVRNVPVALPTQLAKKYPATRHSWRWFWVFPAHSPCVCPRSGEVVRWRCHEANVQKAVRKVAYAMGMEGAFSPHNFRHSYATHLLDSGVKMTAVSEAMGHECIETTAGYDHSDALSVPSPLDFLTSSPGSRTC